MQNMPFFTTKNGVASLTLREIPYTKKAYITIQDTHNPEVFIKECADFCRAVGAEAVFATGHRYLENYTLHTTVMEMKRSLDGLEETDACLLPVQKETLEQWREIYNQRMANISNSAYMDMRQAEKYLQQGSAYFVHRNNQLLGIGIAEDDSVNSIISLIPGAGKDVLLALIRALTGNSVRLEVASDNIPALKLYERLGFTKIREISTWYIIF